VVIKLKYGNTNTFFVLGELGNILIDTDYAGTLPAFYKAIKEHGIKIGDIDYILATHYHPDHMGIIGDLQNLGIRLVIVDVQQDHIHFPDDIFAREKHLSYTPVDEKNAIKQRFHIRKDNTQAYRASAKSRLQNK